MLCQHCNHNQAEYHFVVNYGGQVGDVHLCPECAQTLARQYQSWVNEPAYGGMQAFFAPGYQTAGGSFGYQGVSAADRFPAEADEAFKQRRLLGELRARLKQAVTAEEYEEAARLRDEITRAEKSGVPAQKTIGNEE